MEQLKCYESPELEIIIVDDSDVIITSGDVSGGLVGGGDDPFGGDF